MKRRMGIMANREMMRTTRIPIISVKDNHEATGQPQKVENRFENSGEETDSEPEFVRDIRKQQFYATKNELPTSTYDPEYHPERELGDHAFEAFNKLCVEVKWVTITRNKVSLI
jgi:hypothetical protein